MNREQEHKILPKNLNQEGSKTASKKMDTVTESIIIGSGLAGIDIDKKELDELRKQK